jgi:tetratricopeptide (TPR) repeat protein
MAFDATAALPLDIQQRLLGRPVQLSYQPPSIGNGIGTLYLIDPAGPRISIPWVKSVQESRVATARLGLITWPTLVPALLAQGVTATQVDTSFDRGTIITELYQPRAEQQRVAVKAIAHAGTRGCQFIREQLSDRSPFDEQQRSNVLGALAAARDSLTPQSMCASADLPLALAYYRLRDFSNSARYFDRVPASQLTQSIWWYYRGVAYAQTLTRDTSAVVSFQTYYDRTSSPVSKAAARTNLGAVHLHMGRVQAAINDYEVALSLVPDQGAVRAEAMNNLAYAYALSGTKLDSALRLSDQSLNVDTTPARLDTKAWVLFRLGRCAEADSLSLRASRLDPDTLYQSHSAAIRSAQRDPTRCH